MAGGGLADGGDGGDGGRGVGLGGGRRRGLGGGDDGSRARYISVLGRVDDRTRSAPLTSRPERGSLREPVLLTWLTRTAPWHS